jgi:hypothetical protein
VEFAPQSPIEQRAWNACQSPGVWRWHYGEVREGGEGSKIVGKRWPEGLILSEVLARCPPADDDERAALMTLFEAIEAGAITGAAKGLETFEERQQEEGGA